jgi:hypothetical protein
MSLGKGKYEYKFIKNEKWFCDDKKPKVSDNKGGWNNLIILS